MERMEFMQNYGTVVSHTWMDDAYLQRLVKEPHDVLAEAGLDTPANATISIITRPMDPNGQPDTQYALWQKGIETGNYEIVIPLKPEGFEIDEVKLSDEMMEMVSGGITCCCCCPCCCCSTTGE